LAGTIRDGVSAVALTKLGTGTLTLSGANTYSGPTAINAGTLAAGAGNAFSANSAFTVASGAQLDLGGYSQTVGSFSGDGTITNSRAGSPATLTSGGDNTAPVFNGLIQDGASSIAIAKIGAGTLTLTGLNTYSGGTIVTGGLISFNSSNNFGSGNITLDGGGLQWATGTTTDISPQLAPFGAGGATFDTNGNNVTLGSSLSSTGGLTKTGTGTLTLSAVNSYQGGTSINARTLHEAWDN